MRLLLCAVYGKNAETQFNVTVDVLLMDQGELFKESNKDYFEDHKDRAGFIQSIAQEIINARGINSLTNKGIPLTEGSASINDIDPRGTDGSVYVEKFKVIDIKDKALKVQVSGYIYTETFFRSEDIPENNMKNAIDTYLRSTDFDIPLPSTLGSVGVGVDDLTIDMQTAALSTELV